VNCVPAFVQSHPKSAGRVCTLHLLVRAEVVQEGHGVGSRLGMRRQVPGFCTKTFTQRGAQHSKATLLCSTMHDEFGPDTRHSSAHDDVLQRVNPFVRLQSVPGFTMFTSLLDTDAQVSGWAQIQHGTTTASPRVLLATAMRAGLRWHAAHVGDSHRARLQHVAGHRERPAAAEPDTDRPRDAGPRELPALRRHRVPRRRALELVGCVCFTAAALQQHPECSRSCKSPLLH
jgi:hypothetical protein